MTFYNEKIMKKYDNYTRKLLYEGCAKLNTRYDTYKSTNSNVFGSKDDTLVHDIINGCFVYKCRINKLQLRILYYIGKKTNELIILGFFIKNNAKTSKEYIHYFEQLAQKIHLE